MFEQSLLLLQTHCCLSIPVLNQFSAIYLLDSSQVAVPTSMITEYPATGGDGPKAGVKWQVLCEVLTGNLHHVLGQPAKQSDHRYRHYMDWVTAGSLILFDLGYVALPALQQLVSRQVYFICRWNLRFQAFTSEGEPFDLRAHLAALAATATAVACSVPQVELDLRVGVQVQLPLRVVAFHLPVAVCEQRRRRANATERKRGFAYTAEYKTMLDWNVYITNVGPEQLTGEQVSRVYRLRWQVELLFKLWKSEAELDNVRGKVSGRVLCEMYAKLIGLAVFGYLIAPVRLTDRELSAVQAWQVLCRHIEKVGYALYAGARQALQQALTLVYQRWERYAQKQSRPDRPTTIRQLQLQIVNSLT
ncbi:MAG: IS4 family transposase [Chloroflexota bacterium]|nr:IS4 family transposase [Chloroflexota bacterium]